MDQDEGIIESRGSTEPPETVADVFPAIVVTLEEAQRRVKMLKEFVREHLQEGEDYGVIPGSGTKPVLFKSGAEKLNAIFGLAPLVAVSHRLEDWDSGFVSYEVKITLLNKRTGVVEAEGIGSCNSRERRYKNQDSANIANTLLKMAKKRALIDATLSATRASGMFTQEPEDFDDEGDARPAQFARSGDANGRPSEPSDERSGPANGLTEAQRGAILAIAKKVFGHSSREEMAKIVDKPINLLTKSEASAVIDRLRAMMPAQTQTRPDTNGEAA